jgi:hypothetical protein
VSAVLRLLWGAYHQADAGDRWQYAVRLAELGRVGVTEADLRQMIGQKLVECREETTADHSKRRRFRTWRGPAIPTRSCFVLSEAGARVASELTGDRAAPAKAASATDAPSGDERDGVRVLRWGGRAKPFVQEAKNQTTVLKAFQAGGWPEWIPNPLPPDPEIPRRRKLLTTVKNLNRALKGWPLSFRAGTKKDLIGWERLV